MRLGDNRYGKSGIRLVRVTRDGQRHTFTDLTVDVWLQGDFEAAHVAGENRNVLPTDTMRGTVYAFARQHPVDAIEDFGLRLARHFVETVPAVASARIRLSEAPWERIQVDGQPHDHAFVGAGDERRTATVTVADATAGPGTDAHVVAGIDGLLLLKTTRSGFSGFATDRYTTLPETDDRILATAAQVTWRYTTPALDWGACASGVRRTLLETFATHDSRSLQHTLYAMGQAVLGGRPEIAEIRMSMPNKHHLVVDLSPYGLDNPNEVFVATDRPYGVIEAAVVREGVQAVPEAW